MPLFSKIWKYQDFRKTGSSNIWKRFIKIFTFKKNDYGFHVNNVLFVKRLLGPYRRY